MFCIGDVLPHWPLAGLLEAGAELCVGVTQRHVGRGIGANGGTC